VKLFLVKISLIEEFGRLTGCIWLYVSKAISMLLTPPKSELYCLKKKNRAVVCLKMGKQGMSYSETLI
jgi:hypothetical protein